MHVPTWVLKELFDALKESSSYGIQRAFVPCVFPVLVGRHVVVLRQSMFFLFLCLVVLEHEPRGQVTGGCLAPGKK